MHTFIINTVSLKIISALKGTAADIFRQQGQHNKLPDIKFSLVSITAAAAAAIKLEDILF
jgi:hypothetical protein